MCGLLPWCAEVLLEHRIESFQERLQKCQEQQRALEEARLNAQSRLESEEHPEEQAKVEVRCEQWPRGSVTSPTPSNDATAAKGRLPRQTAAVRGVMATAQLKKDGRIYIYATGLEHGPDPCTVEPHGHQRRPSGLESAKEPRAQNLFAVLEVEDPPPELTDDLQARPASPPVLLIFARAAFVGTGWPTATYLGDLWRRLCGGGGGLATCAWTLHFPPEAKQKAKAFEARLKQAKATASRREKAGWLQAGLSDEGKAAPNDGKPRNLRLFCGTWNTGGCSNPMDDEVVTTKAYG